MSASPSTERFVFLFSRAPEEDPFSDPVPDPPKLGFHLCPEDDYDVLQNYALWSCVQESCIPEILIPYLSTNPSLGRVPMHAPMMSMHVPRALYEWLAKLSWEEVMRAVILNLHLGSLEGVPLCYLAPSIRGDVYALHMRRLGRDSGEQKTYVDEEFPAGSCETEHSRQVAHLDRTLCKDGSGFLRVPMAWSLVPTRPAVNDCYRDAAKELCDGTAQDLWKCWQYFIGSVLCLPDVNPSYYADRFSHLMEDESLFFIWEQIKVICELNIEKERLGPPNEDEKQSNMNMDAKRRRWTYRSYLAHLPEEIVTERVIPMLFLDAGHMPRFLGKRRGESYEGFA
ncbi:hypothetical protein FGB62_25g036 [Gracilaria domingensis]|nr:hypothetical protein FGB62_25g036 [Gracilaria domingensis]